MVTIFGLRGLKTDAVRATPVSLLGRGSYSVSKEFALGRANA